MTRVGSADLPLHYGSVPQWLLQRMSKMSLAITESILSEYGRQAFLRRLSNPFWFQSFGAVMGMDWHSSGITTSVMGVMKRTLNPLAKELGIYVCGGKGKASLQTPAELLSIANKTGVNGTTLVHCSKLTAKIDNTAVQDGYQLYLHNFIVTPEGDWTVIQQGMDTAGKTARRYHWHSESMRSFLDNPHTGICGTNQGMILNLADGSAKDTRTGILDITRQDPFSTIREFQHLTLPNHHDVKHGDVNMKRLGAVLWLARDKNLQSFEDLLLLEGAGPRTIQSLALVSEVIHGTPSRFKDPARFSFAHGGKDSHPFPVPLKVYDETISILQNSIEKSKLGFSDKQAAIKSLHSACVNLEKDFEPSPTAFVEAVAEEKRNSWKFGGRTVKGVEKPQTSHQLRLFDV